MPSSLPDLCWPSPSPPDESREKRKRFCTTCAKERCRRAGRRMIDFLKMREIKAGKRASSLCNCGYVTTVSLASACVYVCTRLHVCVCVCVRVTQEALLRLSQTLPPADITHFLLVFSRPLSPCPPVHTPVRGRTLVPWCFSAEGSSCRLRVSPHLSSFWTLGPLGVLVLPACHHVLLSDWMSVLALSLPIFDTTQTLKVSPFLVSATWSRM